MNGEYSEEEHAWICSICSRKFAIRDEDDHTGREELEECYDHINDHFYYQCLRCDVRLKSCGETLAHLRDEHGEKERRGQNYIHLPFDA